jgi:cbb3-type cytochrome oxidase maturation protein
MGILFLLIGISLLVGCSFLGAFFWAFRTGQFDDTYTPGMRILDYPEPTGAELATGPKKSIPD